MQIKTKRRLAVALLIGAVAAVGGNAFTNSITGVADDAVRAGYASATVSGANATNVTYNYSTNKATLETIDLTLDGDTTSAEVRVGFNDDDPIAVCLDNADAVPATSIYTCTVNMPVVDIESTQITVIDNDPDTGV